MKRTRLVFGLLTGLIVGLVAVLAGGLVGGLSGRQINEDMRIQPNQGIQNSGRNALRVGLVSILLIALATVRVTAPLTATLTVLFGGLAFGGEAYFEHYVLRCFLWSSGAVPWHYVRFLEESTKRILLHRVGGGYRFIHPLFLDYFASGAVTASLGIAPLPVP